MDEMIRVYDPCSHQAFNTTQKAITDAVEYIGRHMIPEKVKNPVVTVDEFLEKAMPSPEEDNKEEVSPVVEELMHEVWAQDEEPEEEEPEKKINLSPKWQSRLDTLREVLANQKKREDSLRWRHPWASLFYKYVVILLVAATVISSIWAWGSDHKMKKEEAIRAIAYAEGQEAVINEQKAADEAEANSVAAYKKKIDDLKASDTKLLATFMQGIEPFETNEKYNYGPIDVETYAQCPINRVLDETEFSWCTTLENAIMQEGQWVGMSMSNQPTQRNIQIATKLVNRLYGVLYPDLYPNEDPMPCSSKYCWTEFTKNGLWLKSVYGTATFNNTWRAGS